MAAFRFALDPLLRIRRQREEAAQRAVAALEHERRDLEDRLRQQQENLAAGRQAVRHAIVGRVDLLVVRGQSQAALHLMRRAHQVVLQLAGLHRRIEQARGVLLKSARDRRAIEMLRERRLAEWKADIERKDIAAIDELAIVRAGRRDEPS